MAAEKFPIERGQVMMFARAIGDYNPMYFAEEGAIAPPTFMIADLHFDPETGLRPRPDRVWRGSGKEPTRETSNEGGGGLGLHAEETFEIFRPVRVGEVLTKTTRRGETWEKEGRRGGKMLFSESVHEYRDENGELVVVARQVGVRTERNPGPDVPLSAAELTVGDVHKAVVVEDLKRTQIVQYAGASGDFNPLHTDEIYATQVAGSPSVFGHGMLAMGLTGKMLTDWVGADRVTLFGGRFTSQIWPGDTLTATATVDAVRETDGQHFVDVTISTTDQDGKQVFAGRASARIDA